jgi:hypothetical protein
LPIRQILLAFFANAISDRANFIADIVCVSAVADQLRPVPRLNVNIKRTKVMRTPNPAIAEHFVGGWA